MYFSLSWWPQLVPGLAPLPSQVSCSHCTSVTPSASNLLCAAGNGMAPPTGREPGPYGLLKHLKKGAVTTELRWRCKSVYCCSCTCVSTLHYSGLANYVTPLGDPLLAYAVMASWL